MPQENGVTKAWAGRLSQPTGGLRFPFNCIVPAEWNNGTVEPVVFKHVCYGCVAARE